MAKHDLLNWACLSALFLSLGLAGCGGSGANSVAAASTPDPTRLVTATAEQGTLHLRLESRAELGHGEPLYATLVVENIGDQAVEFLYSGCLGDLSSRIVQNGRVVGNPRGQLGDYGCGGAFSGGTFAAHSTTRLPLVWEQQRYYAEGSSQVAPDGVYELQAAVDLGRDGLAPTNPLSIRYTVK